MDEATFQIGNARLELVNDVLEAVDGLLRDGSHCIVIRRIKSKALTATGSLSGRIEVEEGRLREKKDGGSREVDLIKL